MKKRILIFSTVYLPFVGGAEVAVKEITDRLDEYEFDMITARLDRSLPRVEKVGHVLVYRVGWGLKIDKMLLPFVGAWKAMRLFRKCSYDASWAIMASYGGLGALFFHIMKPSVPYVLTLQEGDPLPDIIHKVRWIKPIFRRIFTRAHVVHAISGYLGEWARTMGHAGDIRVIPNGYDEQVFEEEVTSERQSALRAEVECVCPNFFDGAELVLVTTSRLVKKNAVDVIISALEHVPAGVRLLVVGNGELREVLEQQVQDRGVADRVCFMGERKHEDIATLFSLPQVKVFIRPSRSEGMGNSFIEAMAAGLPIIATDVGGISDFLKDRETGLVVEVDSPEDVARAIRVYCDDDELYQRIKEAGKTFVQNNYRWDNIVQRMRDNVFESVI